METEAITTYLAQQRQVPWLILGWGTLSVIAGGLGLTLLQHGFLRGICVGLLIVAPLFLYYGLRLPGQLERQHSAWTEQLSETPPVRAQLRQELETLRSGIDRLAWIYMAVAATGLLVAMLWREHLVGGIGAGVALMFLTSLIIEQVAKRHAVQLLAALAGGNS